MTKQTDVNDLLRRVMESESRHVKPTGYSHGNCVKCEAHAYLDSLEQGPRIQPDANWITEASRMLDRLDSLEAKFAEVGTEIALCASVIADTEGRVERIEKALRGMLKASLIETIDLRQRIIARLLRNLAPPSTQEDANA